MGKREDTMIERYGPDWRKIMGQRAKKARERKHGKELYAIAGKKGGQNQPPELKSFSVNRELASRAGKKGAEARWGKKE